MATPKKPRDRRTVSPLSPDEVPDGAVGAQLAPNRSGLRTASDMSLDKEDARATRAEKIRRFLQTARQRHQLSATAESQLRADMLDDTRFYNSEQWPEHVKAERFLDKRPILTINRLPQFVRQVVNQAIESKPAIQINPVDNGADPDTAEVLQGLCRNIERNSRAHIAYAKAIQDQAVMGRGWIKVQAEYARDDSMEQEIKIKRVMDQFTVYPDPACSEPDYSDATFCIIVEHVPLSEYKARYPHAQAVSRMDFQSIGDGEPTWFLGNAVMVAEYFYVESVPSKLVDILVNDGEEPKRATIYRDMVSDVAIKSGIVTILKERDTVRRQVKWALINGVEILDGNDDKTEGRDIPGAYIPVVPVLGEELVVNGRKNLRGMVRDAKDPQRAYNFWVSAETEMIALAPRAPVIGAAGQFEGHAKKWAQANRRNYAYLEYEPMELNGNLVPPPQRASFDPNVGPIIQATMQADRDLKSVLGMFDASQERSPEQSGKAIIARQQQGEQGTSHFLENLSRSIEHVGRILLAWIPIYYDTPRMLRIMGLDEQPREVLVHAGNQPAAQQIHDGLDERIRTNILGGRPFDLSVGRYDVTIAVGPSFQSRRQESVEALIQLIQAYPAVMPYIGDVLVGNMDWPGARQIAERLKRVLPPEVRDPEEGKPEIPPQIQQQMAEMQQQLEAAMAALAEKDEIINAKAQELASKGHIEQMKLEANERLEMIRQQGEMLRLQAQIKADTAMELLNAKLEEIKLKLDHAHDKKMEEIKAENYVPPTSSGKPPAKKPAAKKKVKA